MREGENGALRCFMRCCFRTAHVAYGTTRRQKAETSFAVAVGARGRSPDSDPRRREATERRASDKWRAAWCRSAAQRYYGNRSTDLIIVRNVISCDRLLRHDGHSQRLLLPTRTVGGSVDCRFHALALLRTSSRFDDATAV